MQKLTVAMENYLEAIYELSLDGNGVRVSDIARRMGVTKASTNNAMASLSEKGLIINDKYAKIYLTPAGQSLADVTSQKHQTVRRLFISVLGIDPDIADQDACAIEHVISKESILAIQEFLTRWEQDHPC